MMQGMLDLNGTWELYYNDDFYHFLVSQKVPGRHYYKATVPAPVHQVLMDAGVLDDPRIGLNSLRARWVEEMYWSYRRTFSLPDDYTKDTPAWLIFDRLEMNAVIYLNGQEVGRHDNAHRPARFLVTDKLRSDGENIVTVLLEAGLFSVADKPGVEYRDSPQARLTKIHWQRRGQWERGWDWQQRLLNVGILGDVRLEWSNNPVISQLQVFATPSDDLLRATITARLTVLNPKDRELPGHMTIRLPEESESHPVELMSISVSISPGTSQHELKLQVTDPQLWWPIGHGNQTQYLVEVELAVEGETQRVTRRTGIRKVEVDQSAHPVEGKHFILKINNKPIFCKGGNWVPADMLHSTVTPERYRELVDLAIGANFNMLRIWGGGIFADPALLDYCDAQGVLVWHDLLFACSKYPGEYPEFAAEVNREVTWAMREMAHHPSLVVWCGNNEIEEGDDHWGWQQSYRVTPHYALFHRDLPRIATQEAPHCFYWISSPYSPDYKSPRDPTVGDQHPWKVSLQMPGGADWWEYRKMVDRFPNEGGVLGASSPATLRQFLPENERYMLSPSWEHHDNPFAINDISPGSLGHAYQTVQLWSGLEPLSMDWEQYVFASALLQAEGISEYIHNFRRRMFSSASAIFWMYNDSWPVTHGWTIVDYYRRKKLAYHPVRRAFQPISVVVVYEEEGFTVYGINDTPEPWSGQVRFGVFMPDHVGENSHWSETYECHLPPNAAIPIGSTESTGKLTLSARGGGYAVLSDAEGKPVAQHRCFTERFKDLQLQRNPEIKQSLEDGILTLSSDVFCWGVCLDVDGEQPLTDNCFDLLPGIPYSLPWDEQALGEPRIIRLGNRDALP